MRCPACQHQASYEVLRATAKRGLQARLTTRDASQLEVDEVVRCPRCLTVYDAVRLEEWGCLAYLRQRLTRWCAEGLLPAEVAEPLLAGLGQELAGLAGGLKPRRAYPPVATTSNPCGSGPHLAYCGTGMSDLH